MGAQHYLGNPNLKNSNVQLEFSPDQVKELVKCATDPKHFIENYVQIVHVDHGLVPFKLYDYQEEMVEIFHNNRFVISKLPRQSGKSTTIVSYLLHYILFNENVAVAILANKGNTARELLSRMQMSFEHLPSWLQQGVTVWNKGNVELENGSKILAAATSSSAVRGSSFNIIFLDEFAHVDPPSLADEFFNSVYPTISSGNTTKVFIVSTPYGMNKFYKMWIDAEEGRNTYVPFSVNWSDVPGRDDAWKAETIQNTSERQWRQEFECEFLGSTNTLIEPAKLRNMPYKPPIRKQQELDVYVEPQKGHAYCTLVDTASGVGQDYSTFTIIDVTEIPYKVVAKYRNNEISPIIFPNIIEQISTQYNKSWCLVETNGNGMQVGDILYYDLEYENTILTSPNKGGQEVSGGFKKNSRIGLITSKHVKRTGCTTIKELIEKDHLIIEDFDIISELMTFAEKGPSFQAEEGYHDDLVMTLVLFGWLVNQRYFKEITDSDIRKKLLEQQERMNDEDSLPLGFFNDGISEVVAEDDYHVWKEYKSGLYWNSEI
ncbi:uncharacterized protein METZ01_LOCUS41603 [marine metagenome]|uniref:Terminase large subunit gp17-like C-terminal domain-containing protein n=1 Tax=marine metagenome TaxID=408172 RepID=A0A381RCX1_9ZZZZ|tara:strand:- start:461 stop:2095 length:1635 start_codon:yes stop_codon:yes gene_type:complete